MTLRDKIYATILTLAILLFLGFATYITIEPERNLPPCPGGWGKPNWHEICQGSRAYQPTKWPWE